MMKKVILFDIDGTLIRCFGIGRTSLIQASVDILGTSGDMENVELQGKTDPVIIYNSFKNTGLSIELINKNMNALKEKYFEYLKRNIKKGRVILLPGVETLLDKLVPLSNVILGLLTGNFKNSARIKLEVHNLNHFFEFGVFGDDAVNRNDMPAIAGTRVKELFGLDLDYKNMIIIGDTVHDINCAKKAGAISVSVGTGWSEKELLLSQKPDFYFDDLGDTESVLKALQLH